MTNITTLSNNNRSGKQLPADLSGAAPEELPLSGDELEETKKLFRLIEAHLSGTRAVALSTLKVAMGCLRAFLRYTQRPPWQWIKQDVSDFIHAKKIECNLGVSRQAAYFTYLRIFQNYLLSDRNLCNDIHRRFGMQPQEFIGPDNAIPIKRRNKVRKHAIVGLTVEEYQRLLAEFDAAIQLAAESGGKGLYPLLRDKTMAQLAYMLGLRVDELVSLLMTSYFEDPKYHHFGPYSIWTVIGKGSKLRQVRALNPEIKELMDWYLEFVRPRFLNDSVEEANLLFYSERGCKLCAEQFRRRLTRMAAQAGIMKRVTPHILRHTNLTAMVELLGPAGAQAQAGHEYLSTTLGTYYHADPVEIGNRIFKAVSGITGSIQKSKPEDEK